MPLRISDRVVCATLRRDPPLLLLTAWYALQLAGLGAGFAHAYATDASQHSDRVWLLVLPAYLTACAAGYLALRFAWRVSLQDTARALAQDIAYL